jgi:hypothetical protein
MMALKNQALGGKPDAVCLDAPRCEPELPRLDLEEEGMSDDYADGYDAGRSEALEEIERLRIENGRLREAVLVMTDLFEKLLTQMGARRAEQMPPRRPGPVGPMPDAALLQAIRDVLAASPFHGEGHRKVWARPRHGGVRTSKRRVLRLMREHGLLAPSRVGAPGGPRAHDGTIIPDAVDTLWGTDLTTTLTGEGRAAVFVAVDHCSADCVGIHAARHANRFEALEPLRQGGSECQCGRLWCANQLTDVGRRLSLSFGGYRCRSGDAPRHRPAEPGRPIEHRASGPGFRFLALDGFR